MRNSAELVCIKRGVPQLCTSFPKINFRSAFKWIKFMDAHRPHTQMMRRFGLERRCSDVGSAYSIRMDAGAHFVRVLARLVGINRLRRNVNRVQRNPAVSPLSRSIFVVLLASFPFYAVSRLARIDLRAVMDNRDRWLVRLDPENGLVSGIAGRRRCAIRRHSVGLTEYPISALERTNCRHRST